LARYKRTRKVVNLPRVIGRNGMEVEVLALNLSTGTMHVRTLGKVALFKTSRPEVLDWTEDIDKFFEKYSLVEKELGKL